MSHEQVPVYEPPSITPIGTIEQRTLIEEKGYT